MTSLYVVLSAIAGSALITGLLFAFSLVVMRALAELPAATAARTMQRINVLIVNPLFLLLFLGTALLCALIALGAGRASDEPGSRWLLAGALCYLAGPLGITVSRNVPLNDRLAALEGEAAALFWPQYVSAWLRWNHIRTLVGVGSVVLLARGLA